MTLAEAVRESMETGRGFRRPGDEETCLMFVRNRDIKLIWRDGVVTDPQLTIDDVVATDWELGDRLSGQQPPSGGTPGKAGGDRG